MGGGGGGTVAAGGRWCCAAAPLAGAAGEAEVSGGGQGPGQGPGRGRSRVRRRGLAAGALRGAEARGRGTESRGSAPVPTAAGGTCAGRAGSPRPAPHPAVALNGAAGGEAPPFRARSRGSAGAAHVLARPRSRPGAAARCREAGRAGAAPAEEAAGCAPVQRSRMDGMPLAPACPVSALAQ